MTKSFDGRSEIKAVDNVSLEITPGEFIAIVGPSGCGKSTLLSLTAGLMKASSGMIQSEGRAVEGPIESLGIVFQQHLLLPWRTILQNVLIQAEIRRMPKIEALIRATDLLHRVGLGDFLHRYPDELSGGMNQRAAICRALLHDPRLLLMDEPFGALDAMTRDQMALDFHRLSQTSKKTIVLVTHSINEAVFLADRIVVMTPRPGRIHEVIDVPLGSGRKLSLREDVAFTQLTRRLREAFEIMGVLGDDSRGT